jgi:hypothetical protein
VDTGSPAASAGSAAWSRSSVRHRPNGIPVPVRNARASVPTTALQNQILAEALRVLRPGGVLVGSDSLPSDGLHCFHEGDTCHPIEPSTLLVRLQTLGFGAVMVAVDEELMFTARKPGPQDSDPLERDQRDA